MSTVAYPKCKFTTEYSKNNIVQYLVFTEYTMFNETVVYLTVIICMITEQYMRGTIRLLYGGLRSAQKQWEDKSKPFSCGVGTKVSYWNLSINPFIVTFHSEASSTKRETTQWQLPPLTRRNTKH